MTAGIATEGVAIAEDPRTSMPIERLGQLRVGVGVIATGEGLLPTVLTIATTQDRDRNDPIATAELRDGASSFDDFSQEFVANHVPGMHRGHQAIEQMQVRSANR